MVFVNGKERWADGGAKEYCVNLSEEKVKEGKYIVLKTDFRRCNMRTGKYAMKMEVRRGKEKDEGNI